MRAACAQHHPLGTHGTTELIAVGLAVGAAQAHARQERLNDF